MNNGFLELLKKQHSDKKINTELFMQMLTDEEYLSDEAIQNCFFCGNQGFDIVRGGEDVYEYIAYRMQGVELHDNIEYHFEEVHHLGLLCNWLNFHGIPIFADAEKFPDIALIYCKNCGQVLGIKLDKWYYPYCGYFDEVKM